MSVMSMQNI